MELLVAMVVSSLILIGAVAMMVTWTRQFAVMKTRQDLNASMQLAMTRITNDIRTSSGVALYNITNDPNAPAEPTHTNISGLGTPMTGYTWRADSDRLLLVQQPRTADGSPAPAAPSAYNTIVYYLKDGALWRRVIAGSASVDPTLVCPVETNGGCTQGSVTDSKIASVQNGTIGFSVAYTNSNGSVISPGGDGTVNSTLALAARGVHVNLSFVKNQSGENVAAAQTSKVGFRSGFGKPAPVPAQPNPYMSVADIVRPVTIGPGGINITSTGTLYADAIVSQGQVDLNTGTIGSATHPVRTDAANRACGTSATWPNQLCGTPSVVGANLSAIYGNICANGTVTPGWHFTVAPGNIGTKYTSGIMSGCTPVEATLPTFDKAGFMSSMKYTRGGFYTICVLPNQRNDIEPDTTYNTGTAVFGNSSGLCQGTIKGNAYIAGDLNLSFGTLQVSEHLEARPTIVASGKIDLKMVNIIPNSRGIAPIFVSFKSTNPTCSTSTSTTCLTTAQRQSSVDTEAVRLDAMNDATGSIFYAYHGKVYSQISGGASIDGIPGLPVGAVIGQKLQISTGGLNVNSYNERVQ